MGSLPFVVNGTIYRKGAIISITNGSATKTVTTKINGGQNKASLSLTGLSFGLYNLTVRNSDGVNGTATDIFYVTDQAWISSAPKTISRPSVQKSMVPSAGSRVTSRFIIGPFNRQVIGAG